MKKLTEYIIGSIFILSGIAKLYDFRNTSVLFSAKFGIEYRIIKYLILVFSFVEIIAGLLFVYGVWGDRYVYSILSSPLALFVGKGKYIRWKNLIGTANIRFGLVKKEDYMEKFGMKVNPVIYVFNSEEKLEVRSIGETLFDRILGAISKSGDAQRRAGGIN